MLVTITIAAGATSCGLTAAASMSQSRWNMVGEELRLSSSAMMFGSVIEIPVGVVLAGRNGQTSRTSRQSSGITKRFFSQPSAGVGSIAGTFQAEAKPQ